MRQIFKEENYNLVNSIVDIVKIKEIHLDLVKVKGHSENRWNILADSLAKLGTRLEDKDDIVERPPRSQTSLCVGKMK